MNKLNTVELRAIEAGANTYTVGPFTVKATSSTSAFNFDWNLGSWTVGSFSGAKVTSTTATNEHPETFTMLSFIPMANWKYTCKLTFPSLSKIFYTDDVYEYVAGFLFPES